MACLTNRPQGMPMNVCLGVVFGSALVIHSTQQSHVTLYLLLAHTTKGL